jgi:hypothetical protein
MLPLVFAASMGAGTGDRANAAGAGMPTGESVTPINQLAAPRDLRRGLVVGFDFGASLGGASGYPNNSSDIGNPDEYSASGFAAGTYASIFVMGALSDYISVGFWYGHRALHNADWRSGGDGGGLRVEGFPLVGLVPKLSGLGVLAQFGIGSGQLSATGASGAESNGTQSFGGAGVFYEWSFGHVLGGHLAAGPSLEYDAIWTRPFEQHGLVATLRFVFYGGP